MAALCASTMTRGTMPILSLIRIKKKRNRKQLTWHNPRIQKHDRPRSILLSSIVGPLPHRVLVLMESSHQEEDRPRTKRRPQRGTR